MPYSRNPNNPMVILATTANNLLQQYQTNEITFEQFKESMNNQVVPLVATLDKSSPNDDAMYTISYAVAMVDGVE